MTPRSITLRGVELRAVLDNFVFSDISISWLGAVWYCAELDSVQCDSAQSLTQRSITLRGVMFFVNIFAKTNSSANPFQTVYQGPEWVRFIKKKFKKSCDTASLMQLPKKCHFLICANLMYIDIKEDTNKIEVYTTERK